MIPQLAFTIVTAFTCPNVTVVNKTSTWGARDDEAMETAKKRCPEVYIKAPCLKIFTKEEDGVYRAICGNSET